VIGPSDRSTAVFDVEMGGALRALVQWTPQCLVESIYLTNRLLVASTRISTFMSTRGLSASHGCS